MTLHRFDVDALPASGWKNGGGVTREIACFPPDAGLEGFGWRISIATISADGDFSAFPGVERTIVLLQEGGMQLQAPAAAGRDGLDETLREPLQSLVFGGELPIACRLLAGASQAFNLMARRSAFGSSLQVFRRSGQLAGSTHGMLLAVKGNWRLRPVDEPARQALPAAAQDHVLASGAGLWWTQPQFGWQLEPEGPDAALIAVRLWSKVR